MSFKKCLFKQAYSKYAHHREHYSTNQEFLFIPNIPKYAQHNMQFHLMHIILCT